MARIFWVVCPQCTKKFYAAKDDFQEQGKTAPLSFLR